MPDGSRADLRTWVRELCKVLSLCAAVKLHSNVQHVIAQGPEDVDVAVLHQIVILQGNGLDAIRPTTHMLWCTWKIASAGSRCTVGAE